MIRPIITSRKTPYGNPRNSTPPATAALRQTLPDPDCRGDRPLPLNTVQGEVQFEGITFAYEGRSNILKQLSLSVPAGKTIGIVGETGSGKSTLMKLLLRFYEAQQGQILIDGIDIREVNLFDLRQYIGWVSQDVFLFHGTVAENIRYGCFNDTIV